MKEITLELLGTYFVVINKITQELFKRKESYSIIKDFYGFIFHLIILTSNEIRNGSKNL